MRVESARLDTLRIPLVEPFQTSFGVQRRRELLLVRLTSRSGVEGIGECVATREPMYSSETVTSAREAITRLLAPMVLRAPDAGPLWFGQKAARWRGQPMAKAAVEAALWDLAARESETPLAAVLGGRRRRVEVGVSVGIQPSVAALVRRVGRYLEEGYRRVKLKVQPGWDDAPVGAVRSAYPDVRLWVDANQAYAPRHFPELVRWARRWDVEQVEQPFEERALELHARLARRAPFRVCLDESIVGMTSLEDALARRALTSLNVKAGRVGGVGVARDLGRRAATARVPAWVGGMLETGVGRAVNLALASLPQFSWPGDISASRRYFAKEIIDRPFELNTDGTIDVPRGAGTGVQLDPRSYRRYLVRSRSLRV